MRAHYFVLVALLGVWSTGCESEHFRAETRLLEDGSLERIVYQPLARTPEKAQQPNIWLETDRVPKAELAEHQRMPLRQLVRNLRIPVPSQHKSPVQYWMADGKFANASAIPDALKFDAPEGLSDGRLIRQLDRRDLGFVTEWIWRETLTDAVTVADHRLARIEVADLVATLTIAACTEAWGPDYDLKKLEHWLRQDVTNCFQELCDAFLEVSLKKSLNHAEIMPLMERGAKILKRYGLDLFDAEQRLLKNDAELRDRLQKFVNEKLQQLVRDKNDRPLKDELLQDTIKTFWSGPDETGDTKLKLAFQRAAMAKFKTDEKIEKELSRLAARILGLYHWPLHGERKFDYRMEFPGMVVETNGILIGDRTVRWKFEATEAFPLGHSMRAVVAVVSTAALTKHFPRARFDRRETVVEYLDLVDADDDLRDALNELVQKNEVAAWNDWQVKNLDATRILELLQPKVEAR